MSTHAVRRAIALALAAAAASLALSSGIGVRVPITPPVFSIDSTSPDVGAPLRQADILTRGGGVQPAVVTPAQNFVQNPFADELDGLSVIEEGPAGIWTGAARVRRPKPPEIDQESMVREAIGLFHPIRSTAASLEGLSASGDSVHFERGVCPQCAPEATPEAEPNCGLPFDTFNGGCNSVPRVSTPITCEQAICGTFAFNGSVRDTDWYNFTVPGVPGTQTDVTLTAFADSPFVVGFTPIVCTGVFDAFAPGSACQTVSVTRCLPAGLVVYVVMVPQFVSIINCGDPLTSDYQISVDCAPGACPPPINDECGQGPTLAVPSSTAGSTVGATVDAIAPSPCGPPIASAGVWYRVIGNGNTIIASLCNGFSSFDTRLSVYCGSCEGLSCIDGNDNACGSDAQVSWCSEIGRTYYILVHGAAGQSGSFQLDIFDDGNPCAEPGNCPETFVIFFGVDRESVGAVPPDPTLLPTFPFNVQDQAAKNQAPGDMFVATHLYTRSGPVLPPPFVAVPGRNNVMVLNHGDAGGNDFNIRPDAPLDSPAVVVPPGTPASNNDSAMGSETPVHLGPPTPQQFFFSLRSGSPSLPLYPNSTPGGSGADIIVDMNPLAPFPSAERTYARAAQLGLLQIDDIDELIVFDDGALTGGFPFYNAATDQVLFSLARGSPSAGTAGPAAIFTTTTTGGFQLFAAAADLGLEVDDNVDLLDYVLSDSISDFIEDHAVGYVCDCPVGDANCDNLVNLTDLSQLLAAFGGADSDVDFNEDGFVNLTDLSLLLSVFGADCGPN